MCEHRSLKSKVEKKQIPVRGRKVNDSCNNDPGSCTDKTQQVASEKWRGNALLLTIKWCFYFVLAECAHYESETLPEAARLEVAE